MASPTLLLIHLLQVLGSQAHPLFQGSSENSDSVLFVEYSPDTETTNIPYSTPSLTNLVYQIAVSGTAYCPYETFAEVYIQDGQVQAYTPFAHNTDTELPMSVISFLSTSSELSARDLWTTTSPLDSPVPSSATLTETRFLFPEAAYPFVTSVPASSLTSLTTSAVQTATDSGPLNTEGTVVSTLEQTISSLPFLTTTSYTTSSLSLVDSTALSEIQPTATSVIGTLFAGNIFQPIATDPPPPQVSQTSDHPVPRLNIQPQRRKLQTNKFYSNFYLGNQSNAVFTFPYSITWIRGGLVDPQNRSSESWGMAVSHIERNDVVHAEPKIDPSTGLRLDAGDWAFYSNPLGTKSIVLSASELVETPDGYPGLDTRSLEWGSVSAELFAYGWKTPTIRFPLVQGTSFITANYSWATPLIQSGYGFKNVTYVGAVDAVGDGSTVKYTAQLMGDTPIIWLIYITPDPILCPDYAVSSFTYDGSMNIQGASGFSGLVQVAKVPVNALFDSDVNTLYDQAAGAYAADVSISGSVQNTLGEYSLSWEKRGNPNQSLLMFALPHHLSSFNSDTAAGIKNLSLMTPTKGTATAIQADSWTLVETDLPIQMNFAPYSATKGPIEELPDEVINAIQSVGHAEIAQNIAAQANTNTTYYDGKALAKFAGMIYVLHQLAGEERLAASGLIQLEEQFEEHVNGQQTFPLIYESAWGGTVSSASYVMANVPGSSGYDFGNSYYNDHHFHYGYFVYSAAVIGYLDPGWLDQGTNKAWVNMLVRDYANSIADDPYFPFSRSFDWYHGHSWAAGLFDSADGKNQESSSEDAMASYAIKMWGQVIGDTNMMARGNLMLAIQARSLQNYYLYDTQNSIQPPEFIGNKAAGILFENKIDHTTYFGALPEYTQGIHMIPIMPFSTYIRTPTLVQQEWDVYFANYGGGAEPYINRVQGGWRGILMANYAIVNPNTSYVFFNDSSFDQLYLDNGASQTWYLAWAAALKEAAGY